MDGNLLEPKQLLIIEKSILFYFWHFSLALRCFFFFFLNYPSLIFFRWMHVKDTKTAVDELQNMLNIIVGIVILIVWLVILGTPILHFVVFIGSQLLLAVFVFGNSCRTVFEAIIFLFVMHPFWWWRSMWSRWSLGKEKLNSKDFFSVTDCKV